MSKRDLYRRMAEQIIHAQEKVIGDIAYSEAVKVPGLIIKSESVLLTQAQEKEVINGLVWRYKKIFGPLAEQISIQAVKYLISCMNKEEIPESLLQKKSSVKSGNKTTVDLYKNSIEINRKNEELERTNKRLKELLDLKSEFIALATHHISSPLTIIKNYVSMVRDGNFGLIPKPAADTLATVEKSTDNSIYVIRDFLEVTQLDDDIPRFEMQEVTIHELIQELVERYQHKMDAGVSLVVEPVNGPARVSADSRQLMHALGKIIENCIKFTSKGFISISLTTTADNVRITIQDTSSRRVPTTPSKLIQKFTENGNPQEADIIGSGLGLYIAKKIIEGQGGKLMIETHPEGTKFEVILKKLSE